MRNFNAWPFYGLIMKDILWLRCKPFKFGISIKRTRKLFSERNGFIKTYNLLFGWRLQFLRASK